MPSTCRRAASARSSLTELCRRTSTRTPRTRPADRPQRTVRDPPERHPTGSRAPDGRADPARAWDRTAPEEPKGAGDGSRGGLRGAAGARTTRSPCSSTASGETSTVAAVSTTPTSTSCRRLATPSPRSEGGSCSTTATPPGMTCRAFSTRPLQATPTCGSAPATDRSQPSEHTRSPASTCAARSAS